MVQKMWSGIVWFLFVITVALSKKCCDPDCNREWRRILADDLIHFSEPSVHFINVYITEAISYGKTVSRFITRETGFLSYPGSATVVVYIKDIDVRGVEMWDAEVRSMTNQLVMWVIYSFFVVLQ